MLPAYPSYTRNYWCTHVATVVCRKQLLSGRRVHGADMFCVSMAANATTAATSGTADAVHLMKMGAQSLHMRVFSWMTGVTVRQTAAQCEVIFVHCNCRCQPWHCWTADNLLLLPLFSDAVCLIPKDTAGCMLSTYIQIPLFVHVITAAHTWVLYTQRTMVQTEFCQP